MILPVFLGAIAMLAAPPTASAVVFNVNTTADGNDFNSADPVCDADPVAPGLQCTLRAAIQQAVTPPEQDMINLPAGTYTLNSPNELMVTSPVIVDGAGAASTIIRQQINGRVIRVTSGQSLDLRDVTVRDGVIAADGGGIASFGTLTLRRSVIANNQAIGSNGGGIHSGSGSLTIEDTVIGGPSPADANEAGSFGAGVHATVGLVMRDSEVLGNGFDGTQATPEGAGIQSFGTTTITRSTIAGNGDNETSFSGGLGHEGGGTLLIRDSTLNDNLSSDGGGALAVRDATGVLENVTISGNRVTDQGGGESIISVLDGQLQASHVTAAGNSLPGGTTLLVRTASSPSASATLRATILQDPDGRPECLAFGSGTETITSTGFNVIDDTSLCGPAGTGDFTGAPQLAGLADRGGATRTHALLPGSPAIDRVSSGCPSPATDQRGVPRPQGGRCDSGAYELARCKGAAINRVGTAGADVLTGTGGADGFLLLGGADIALAGAGNDRACGGSGNDRLMGQAGRDRLFGEAGRDRLLGGGGRDRLVGGPGRDRLKGGKGRDRLIGGGGRDREIQ